MDTAIVAYRARVLPYAARPICVPGHSESQKPHINSCSQLQLHPSLTGPGTFADLLRELLNGWPGTWQGGQL